MCMSAHRQSKLHRSTQAETTALSETQTGLAASSLPLVHSNTSAHVCVSVSLLTAGLRHRGSSDFPWTLLSLFHTHACTHTCTLIHLHTRHQVHQLPCIFTVPSVPGLDPWSLWEPNHWCASPSETSTAWP